MNLKLIAILLISLIALVGCTVKEQTNLPSSAPETTQINKEALEERTAPSPTANSKVVELLVNKGIIPEIVYDYSRPPEDPKSYIFHLKGSKARIDLPRVNYIPKGEVRLDTAYLDIAAKTATAYCEEKGVCDDRNKPYDLDFNKYYYKNPYDWLQDIPTDAEVVGTEQISTRDVTHLRYVDAGTTTDVWIDEFYKVPLEVQVTSGLGTARYVYHLISVGGVKDSELMHKQLENY